jgi:cephalosporin-C deacetylase-like acetyl esterase
MKSRREFFEASSLALAAFTTGIAEAKQPAEGVTSAQPFATRDYWDDLPNHMIAKVNDARVKRKADLAKVTSSENATDRISMIRTTIWELIGGKLDTSPLRAKTTGIIDRANYQIEKVIFESQPGFYVTAHLYLPKSGRKPFPAVLAPLGHAPEGKAYPSYQTVFQNLARKGFAVLAWDPPGQGERLQYIEPGTNHSLYGPTGEHDHFGWPALLIGSTTTQFEVWDGVRALDYLLSRTEIDGERIGCCGHSGGGTQTMFLCALEPRIKVAVVVEGHTENLAGANYQPPGAFADAEQNLINGLQVALDRGDLLAAFAPKPLRICYTLNDNGTTYSPHYVQGNHEIFEELINLYRIYNCKEKVSLFNSILPHDYDYFQRRATYEWFNKWFLNGEGDVKESKFEEAPESALWCTSTGQVLTSLGGRSAVQVNYDRLRDRKAQADRSGLEKAELQANLRKVLNLPSESTTVRATSLSTRTYDSVVIEGIEYESEPGIRVPGWFLKPSDGKFNFPVAVVVDDSGKDGIFDRWRLIEKLTGLGVAVCSVDLRTYGVTKPRLPSAGPLFYGYGVELAYSLVNLSLGSPILGQQTRDLLRCVDFLRSRPDVDKSHIGVVATGTSGLPCLAGTALDQRVRSLLLNRTLITFESVVASKDYDLPLSAIAFGMLPNLDLPELCAAIAPRPMWLVNTVGPQGKAASPADIRASYEVAIQAYSRAGGKENLSFRPEPEFTDELLVEWAQKALL